MAEDAHALAAAAAEGLDGRPGVGGEVGGGGRGAVAGGGSLAAVVVAQRGDAMPRQVVGDDGERTVTEELLVAVLQAAAGDHHHHWRLRRVEVLGQRERAGQSHPGTGVRNHHLLGDVREWGHGRLRALELRPLHVERQGEHALAESAAQPAVLQPGVIRRLQLRQRQAQGVGAKMLHLGGEAEGSLVGRVESGRAVGADAHRQPQLHTSCLQGAVPLAPQPVGSGSQRRRQRHYRYRYPFHISVFIVSV